MFRRLSINKIFRQKNSRNPKHFTTFVNNHVDCQIFADGYSFLNLIYSMQEWWLMLDLFMKIIWCIAIFSSVIFIVQAILTFIGMDSGTDFSGDFDVDASSDVETPFQLFTFRNLINFLLGFSWTIIALKSTGLTIGWLIFLAIVVGVLLVAAVMVLFVWLNSLQQSGTITVSKTIGCKGNVYLTIPGEQKGQGLVQITVQGAVREYSAQTEGDTLSNGTPIRVVEVLSSNILLVERFH